MVSKKSRLEKNGKREKKNLFLVFFQGDFRHQGDYRRSFPLVNLSYLSSSQSLMIISCETNGRLLQTIKDEDHFEIELESWTVEKRQIYVERFFRQFNKVKLLDRTKKKKRSRFQIRIQMN